MWLSKRKAILGYLELLLGPKDFKEEVVGGVVTVVIGRRSFD